MTPRLSVILPVFNGMPFLPRAVESILNQTFSDFEFIIVNDGSTDESLQYLRSLQDPRIVIVDQPNQGIGASLNTSLHMCRSEYVARMDSDDISKPDRLALQVEYLDAHPEVVLLGTQIEFLIGDVAQRAFTAPVDHDGIEARFLKGRAGLCHPSLMFRTATAIACGGYPAGVFGEDLEFCLRMCEVGRVANLDRVLLQYRLQAAQTSMARSKEVVRVSSYAAYRASCRRKGKPEPALDEFLQSASWFNRFQWSKEAWELIQYRTARIQLAGGNPISGALRLGLLGLCHPVSALGLTLRPVESWLKRLQRRPDQPVL